MYVTLSTSSTVRASTTRIDGEHVEEADDEGGRDRRVEPFRKINAMFAANSPAAQSRALVSVVAATVTANPT